jgi:hypothetical protein
MREAWDAAVSHLCDPLTYPQFDQFFDTLTPAAKLQIPTMEEIEDFIQSFGKPDDEGRGWAVFEKDFDKLAQAIHSMLTARLKGEADHE